MCASPPFSRWTKWSRKARSRSLASPFLPLARLVIFAFAVFVFSFFFFFKGLFLRHQYALRHFRNRVQRCSGESRVAEHFLVLREGVSVTEVRCSQHHHAERGRGGG